MRRHELHFDMDARSQKCCTLNEGKRKAEAVKVLCRMTPEQNVRGADLSYLIERGTLAYFSNCMQSKHLQLHTNEIFSRMSIQSRKTVQTFSLIKSASTRNEGICYYLSTGMKDHKNACLLLIFDGIFDI